MRLRRLILGYRDPQHSVLVLRIDLVGLDGRFQRNDLLEASVSAPNAAIVFAFRQRLALALAGDPDAALAPMFLLSFGLMIGIPLGLATGVFDLTSWSFALWYLAITVIAIGVVGFLSRMLRRQNIVLSSKGA